MWVPQEDNMARSAAEFLSGSPRKEASVMQLETITHWASPSKMIHIMRGTPCNVLCSCISYVLCFIISSPPQPPLSPLFFLTLSIAFLHCSSLVTHSAGGWPKSGSNDHSRHASVQYQERDCKFKRSAVAHSLSLLLCFPN